jgi:hypothetical protein
MPKLWNFYFLFITLIKLVKEKKRDYNNNFCVFTGVLSGFFFSSLWVTTQGSRSLFSTPWFHREKVQETWSNTSRIKRRWGIEVRSRRWELVWKAVSFLYCIFATAESGNTNSMNWEGRNGFAILQRVYRELPRGGMLHSPV